jgi:hypothetical protein
VTKFTYKKRSGGKRDVGSGTRSAQTNISKKNYKKVQNSKLKAKKFSRLCTFNVGYPILQGRDIFLPKAHEINDKNCRIFSIGDSFFKLGK